MRGYSWKLNERETYLDYFIRIRTDHFISKLKTSLKVLFKLIEIELYREERSLGVPNPDKSWCWKNTNT